MKIVCKMTTVLACCQTNRQDDSEGGRKRTEETDRERKRLAKQHHVCHACPTYTHVDKCPDPAAPVCLNACL